MTENFDLAAELRKFSAWEKEMEDADERGHLYFLFVEGHPKCGYTPKEGYEEGWNLVAESETEAIEEAFRKALLLCRVDIDCVPYPQMVDEVDVYPQYVTHGFRLFHRKRLILEYVPPTQEEITVGNVRIVKPRSHFR